MELKYTSSVDTNLILRFLLNDVPKQREQVGQLFADVSQNFYICDLVIAEVIFNLQKMSHSRQEIVAKLSSLFSLDNIHPESPYILDVLDFYLEHPALSFVDCYSAAHAEVEKKEPLLTFDQKLSKQHPSAKLLR